MKVDLKTSMNLKEKLQYFLPQSQKRREGPSLSHEAQAPLISQKKACLLLRKTYPLAHLHGLRPLGSLLCHEPDRSLSLLMRQDGSLSEGLSWSDALFLDTETTGLSGGVGTYAFLIGLGFFTEQGFEFIQLFMRDYDEEEAMLERFQQILQGFKLLVTFNGKGFDMPILEARLIATRQRPQTAALGHLDLLYPARKLFQRRLSNCRLSTLEEQLLGVLRSDDVPAYLIPGIYFDYLRTGRAEGIEKVLEHNTLDVISMASLLSHILLVLQGDSGICSVEDHYYRALFFCSLKNYEESIHCYKQALQNPLPDSLRRDCQWRLSMSLKRLREFEEASALWACLVEEPHCLSLRPYEELAKYYEHREKDLTKAQRICLKALAQLKAQGLSFNSAYINNSLMSFQRRLDRLRAKSCIIEPNSEEGNSFFESKKEFPSLNLPSERNHII